MDNEKNENALPDGYDASLLEFEDKLKLSAKNAFGINGHALHDYYSQGKAFCNDENPAYVALKKSAARHVADGEFFDTAYELKTMKRCWMKAAEELDDAERKERKAEIREYFKGTTGGLSTIVRILRRDVAGLKEFTHIRACPVAARYFPNDLGETVKMGIEHSL